MRLPVIGASVEIMNQGKVERRGRVCGHGFYAAGYPVGTYGKDLMPGVLVELEQGFWDPQSVTFVSVLLIHTDHVREVEP